MSMPTVSICGVNIHKSLLGLVNGLKHQGNDGRWILATRRGLVVASFESEEELINWWVKFQSSQGRIAGQVVIGQPLPKPKVDSKSKPKVATKSKRKPKPNAEFKLQAPPYSGTLTSSLQGNSLQEWDFD